MFPHLMRDWRCSPRDLPTLSKYFRSFLQSDSDECDLSGVRADRGHSGPSEVDLFHFMWGFCGTKSRKYRAKFRGKDMYDSKWFRELLGENVKLKKLLVEAFFDKCLLR